MSTMAPVPRLRTGRAAPAARPLAVQHIPASHPYVASIGCSLPDPPVPGAPPGRWWPHPALTPEWVMTQTRTRSPGTRADLVHLHFGFEHRSPTQLREWIGALAAADIPLVLTVHDLVNPHLPPPSAAPSPSGGTPVDGATSPYDDLLDVLVPAAAAITTLTDGAARVVHRRWHRRAIVHPHPHLVAEHWLERPRRAAPTTTATPAAASAATDAPWVVTVHLKSLRANVDLDAVSTLRRELTRIPGAHLRLHVHTDVLDPRHPRHDARLDALVAAARTDSTLDMRVHEPLDDDTLWADLLDTDLAMLPYRFGTHSGWLELCHDLGTPVLAPAIGHLSDQRRIYTWRLGDHSGLASALTQAYRDARSGRLPERPSAQARRAERRAVQELHETLYAIVMAQNSVQTEP